MRKFFVVSLSLLIVILSFAICFADGGSPIIVPVSSDGSSGYSVEFNNGTIHQYSSNNSPTFVSWYKLTGENKYRILTFSESPNTVVYNNYDGSITTYNLTSEYQGYYYITGVTFYPVNDSFIIGEFSTPQEAIDSVIDSVFSTTFDLTYLVNGSVSWLSTFAQAVKTTPLLLFFVVFIFVGIGIGLLNRFRRG